AATILSKDSNARILLLTTFSDDEYIIRAIQLGAKGYILKQNFESIVPALNAVFNGQTVFGNEIVERIPQILGNKDTLSTNEERNESSFVSNLSYRDFNLNEKEIRIIQLVSDGLNNKEIADELFLSEGTVRNYISLILEKLELRDRTQLACFYYKNLLK
ncbi:MAG: DNA-binding response regulator, partial [Lachnospira sp.]